MLKTGVCMLLALILHPVRGLLGLDFQSDAHSERSAVESPVHLHVPRSSHSPGDRRSSRSPPIGPCTPDFQLPVLEEQGVADRLGHCRAISMRARHLQRAAKMRDCQQFEAKCCRVQAETVQIQPKSAKISFRSIPVSYLFIALCPF